MDEKIQNLKGTTFAGRRFSRQQISEIQRTVAMFPSLSRKELAQTICEHLQWHTPGGDNRYQSCLLLLGQLEDLGILQLPAKVEHNRRGARKQLQWSKRSEPQALIESQLYELMPLRLQVVSEAEDLSEWNEWVDRYHYLGYKHPIGAAMRYYIVDVKGRKLGVLLFSFAVRSLRCRDEWIGWQEGAYKKQLHLVVNNNRFLIFPWVKVNNLASKVLSMACRQLSDDWQCRHGYRPVLVETFVDETRFQASCYRAANWQYLGTTGKASGKSPKGVYVYPLEASFRDTLVHGQQVRASVEKPLSTNVSKQLRCDDRFVQMWRHLIVMVTEVATEFDGRWRRRRRVIDTLLVMLFIFRLVLSDNRCGYTTTLAALWEQCRKSDLALPQAQPVSAAAMCKARNKLDEQVFKILHQRVLQHADAQRNDFLWQGRQLHAVDGSKLTVPRGLLDDGYRRPNEQTHYPQGLLSCLYQVQARIPIHFELVPHANERAVALTHLKVLGTNDVVVYDRGYYSYELLHAHWLHRVDGIFRLQRNMTTVIDQFMQSARTDDMVEVCATAPIRRRIQTRHGRDVQCPPLRVRVVKYTVSETTYTLATTLLDQNRYSIPHLSDAYHARWGVEELFKISKQWLNIEQFHAHRERGVKQEVYAHFVLITLTRICSNYSEYHMQSAPGDNKVRVNFKNALTVLSRHLEELLLKQTQLISTTLERIVNSISGCRHKERPQRSYQRCSKRPRNKWEDRGSAKQTPMTG